MCQHKPGAAIPRERGCVCACMCVCTSKQDRKKRGIISSCCRAEAVVAWSLSVSLQQCVPLHRTPGGDQLDPSLISNTHCVSPALSHRDTLAVPFSAQSLVVSSLIRSSLVHCLFASFAFPSFPLLRVHIGVLLSALRKPLLCRHR